MNIFSNSFFIAFLAALVLTACGGGDATVPKGRGGPVLVDGTNFDSTALGIALAALPLEALSVAEQDTLAYMREEEKLAHDVYAQFDVLYGASTRIFGNISISESTHTEAVRQLLVRYTLPDPTATLGAGLYMNTTLQTLYTNLVATGVPTLVDALKVGATIPDQ